MTPEQHAQANAIFLRAIEVDAAQRAEFVAKSCGGDEALRREVESLLAHHDPQTILLKTTLDTRDLRDSESAAGPHGSGDSSGAATARIGRTAAVVSGALFSRLFGDPRRKAVAILAVCAAVVGLGALVHTLIHRAMKTKLEHELTTLLAADVEALKIWFVFQQSNAQAIAGDPDVRRTVARLVEMAGASDTPATAILRSGELPQLRAQIQPLLAAHGYEGFVLLDAQRRIVAATEDTLIGDTSLTADVDELANVFGQEQRAAMVLPFASVLPMPDADGKYRVGVPVMAAIAPVRDGDRQVVAALGLRIQPDTDFTRILSVACGGNTGETYAFDRSGRMLSESRFDDQLKRIGLLPDSAQSRSTLNVDLRDPGVDMTRGRRPALRRPLQPLTRMAAAAVQGQSGADVDGYRDYRGVRVVGAWTWLDQYQIGVATEIDADEAFAPLRYLHVIFSGLLAVLVVAVVASLWSSFFVARLRHEVREAQQLGQYTLEKRIGEGGMGDVYLARHALLKRPTAVKVLKPDRALPAAVARFEREVQLASQLTHPNTIEIYDFGRTPEGIFYYAMEYLPGITLDQLVRLHGPVPPARTVYIMRQVCGSLSEAHGVGLIHRDIKPHNIMLCERGGEYDFVKVLDFGLVRPVAPSGDARLTADFQVSGTPHYIAPEVLREPQHADARADIYALGVVSFHLLTGRHPFGTADLAVLFHQVATQDPPRPSQRTDAPIPPVLDQLVFDCLARDPARRPAGVSEILAVLDSDLGVPSWTSDQARGWWRTVQNNIRERTVAASMQPSRSGG